MPFEDSQFVPRMWSVIFPRKAYLDMGALAMAFTSRRIGIWWRLVLVIVRMLSEKSTNLLFDFRSFVWKQKSVFFKCQYFQNIDNNNKINFPCHYCTLKRDITQTRKQMEILLMYYNSNITMRQDIYFGLTVISLLLWINIYCSFHGNYHLVVHSFTNQITWLNSQADQW